jgi:putative CocE/NonD family hydrolase
MLPTESIKLEVNAPARMRDGNILYSDIFRPDREGKYPAILIRLPYGKNGGIVRGYLNPQRYVRNGYAVVIQDIRGTGASEGMFYPRVNELNDGYDTIESIAAQPWCDGNVGMYGYSHMGFIQWQAAVAQPPHLKTICPAATSPGARLYHGGALALNHLLGWAAQFPANALGKSKLPPEKLKLLRDRLFQFRDNLTEIYWTLPLKDIAIDDLVKEIDGSHFFFSDYLKYAYDKEFWKASCTPTPLEQVTIPTLHVVGWADVSSSGVLESYVGMSKRGGSELARKNRKLIIGPWIHSPDFPNIAGDMDFGSTSSGAFVDVLGLHIRWFDCWLKGLKNGIMDEPPIQIFVMGSNIWRTEKEWPLARTKYVNYYFHSNGRANSRFGDGTLSTEPPGDEVTDNYLYDPRNPVPTVITPEGSSAAAMGAMGPYDCQDIEERSDVLVYTSETLQTDLEVTGPILVKLYASSSAVDTDFTAKLVDVWPHGRANHLVNGIIRAAYRESDWEARLIQPGKVYEYTIDIGATSNVFKAGHKIRLEISSSSFPSWDRNLNTGHPIGHDAVIEVALQKIQHNREYPSHIVLPVIP